MFRLDLGHDVAEVMAAVYTTLDQKEREADHVPRQARVILLHAAVIDART